MARRTPIDTARAGLFDRLVDRKPEVSSEAKPMRSVNKYGLYESVAQELRRLFNTRRPCTEEDGKDRERTVLDYGVPDFSAFSPKDVDDQKKLAANIKETLETFETRLKDIRIHIEEHPQKPRALNIRIEGILTFESIREPVSFPVLLEPKFEKVTFHGE